MSAGRPKPHEVCISSVDNQGPLSSSTRTTFVRSQPANPSSPATVWGSLPSSLPALETPDQSHTRLTRLCCRAPDRATERQEGKVADEACAVEVGGRGVVGLREGRGSGAKSLSHGVQSEKGWLDRARASLERMGGERTNNPWVTSRTRVGDEHLAHVAEAGSTMPPVLRTSALQSADLAGKPPNDAAASNETLATAPPSPPPSSPPTVSNRRSHGWCGTCFRAPGLRRRKKLKGEVDAGDDAQTLAEETVLRRDAERVKEGILHEDGQRGLLSALTKRRRKRPERIEQVRPDLRLRNLTMSLTSGNVLLLLYIGV